MYLFGIRLFGFLRPKTEFLASVTVAATRRVFHHQKFGILWNVEAVMFDTRVGIVGYFASLDSLNADGLPTQVAFLHENDYLAHVT